MTRRNRSGNWSWCPERGSSIEPATRTERVTAANELQAHAFLPLLAEFYRFSGIRVAPACIRARINGWRHVAYRGRYKDVLCRVRHSVEDSAGRGNCSTFECGKCIKMGLQSARKIACDRGKPRPLRGVKSPPIAETRHHSVFGFRPLASRHSPQWHHRDHVNLDQHVS